MNACTNCGTIKRVVRGDGPITGPYRLCNPCLGAKLTALPAAPHAPAYQRALDIAKERIAFHAKAR
jgi:hypothetical protein